MKRYKLLLLIAGLIIIGCTNNSGRGEAPLHNSKTGLLHYGDGGTLMKIRGCDYALYLGNNSGDFAMVHAGDCNNPIHNP